MVPHGVCSPLMQQVKSKKCHLFNFSWGPDGHWLKVIDSMHKQEVGDYLTGLRVSLSNNNENIETSIEPEIKQGTLILPLLSNMFLEGLANVNRQRREVINKGIGEKMT